MEWKTDNHKLYFTLDGNSESVELNMIPYMHPAIVNMIAYTNLWCYKRGITPNWTSWIRTEEQDRKLNAKSSTHRYRAADLSLKKEDGWDDVLVKRYETDILENFLKYGAHVYVDNELISRPIVLHDNGNGWHAHLQVRH